MTQILRLGIAAALGMMAFAAAAGAQGTCPLSQYASLPLAQTANGKLTIPVELGKATEQFVVAIDNPYSAVTTAFTDRENMIVRPIPTQGLAFRKIFFMNQSATGRAYVPTLGLGKAVLRNVQMLQIPHAVAPGTAGVLGRDVLSNVDVEVNLRAHRLNLFSTAHCTDNLVYWGRSFEVLPITDDGETSFVEMALDGKPAAVKMDLNIDGATMGLATAKVLFGITPQTPGVTQLPNQEPTKTIIDTPLGERTVEHKGDYYEYVFHKLSIKGLAVSNLRVTLFPQERYEPCRGETSIGTGGVRTKCWGGGDLTLGRRTLESLRLYFAFKDKMLYITGPDPDGDSHS